MCITAVTVKKEGKFPLSLYCSFKSNFLLGLTPNHCVNRNAAIPTIAFVSLRLLSFTKASLIASPYKKCIRALFIAAVFRSLVL